MQLKLSYKLNITLSALAVLLLSACNDFNQSQKDSEGKFGKIIYHVSYPYLDSNDIGLNLLPDKMTLTFSGNQFKSESVGGMGLFAAGFISHNDNKTVDHFMKVISSKYVSRFSEKGIKTFYQDFPSYRLESLDSTKKIAGYNCEGTKVLFYNNKISDYVIWSTTELGLTNYNWCSPFPSIEGVLMEYKVQQEGLVLAVKALSIETDSVDMDEFKVPLDYNVVSNRTLKRKIKEAFVSFDY